MLAVKHGYRDISPVTLEVLGGVVSASLYCGEVEGLPAGLVDSFLAELYRCKVCQFTCSPKASIISHLQLRHHRPAAATLSSPGSNCTDKVGGAKDGDTPGGAVPYQLDLNEEAKPSDEDEDFLLYDMLDNMSPPSCDISSEGGLQVAHTCEVSTLFEEPSIFPLKEASVHVSCSSDPPPTKEDVAQSAHLRTLGLCRISSSKASPHSPAPPTVPPPPGTSPGLSQPSSLAWSRAAERRRRPRLRCFLCPLVLPSRRLLDIHVRSHQASGGFGCVRCSWKADSWGEMEPHWRSHFGRREHKEEKKKKKRRKQQERSAAESKISAKQVNSSEVQKVHQQTPDSYTQHHHDNHSDALQHRLIGQEEADKADSRSGQTRNNSLKNISKKKKKEEARHVALACSVCHRKFSTKLTLRRHMGIHQGDKPFTCPHCHYSSRLKASLLQHLRTHTGEKPYRCPECPYASIDRSSLLRHYRTHSHEKPYRCQQCSYSSIQKKSLDLHARRHHTGEAFPCQQCDYASPDRQLLLRHVRTHHASSQHAAL